MFREREIIRKRGNQDARYKNDGKIALGRCG